ncbi:2-dehydro-3-deoxygluconokinase [Aeromonas sp. RU39B]|jgi:2-dehydro-3-deoxygluconokinase|uniref:sugar kinase n=1 Tax=Aeromonas sp. RU39B TaxID=1907416 RepID=UPI000956CF27|nr:sugar kinase [Aeromonas sp. RU39B]SIR33727.1 2-dehydro-3-deoxygluconokinase [Aeromonas sp. RU39B]
MTTQIAVIGECMIELAEAGQGILRQFGGDTLNTAVYLTRANPSLAVHYVTALGTDPFSDEMLARWQEEGVQTDLVQRLGHKMPGLYWIKTDSRGERTFHYWRSDAAARYWLQSEQTDAVCERLAAMDYLYLSGITLAILPAADRARLLTLLDTCRARGGKVVFDNNYRPRLWEDLETARHWYREVMNRTDIAFLTFDDELALWGEHGELACIERSREWGVSEIVIKRGGEPCMVITAAEPLLVAAEPLKAEQIVDTTAAGDSFSAGYLAIRLAGGSPEQSARYAHQLAGTVIQHRGAIIANALMPTSPVSVA